MNCLPKDYEKSWTISKEIFRRGVCLHSGLESEVFLLPFDKPGFYFSWVGQNTPPVKLGINQIRESSLCTMLDIEGNNLSTVEHLLAALSGCGVTHVHIKVSGNEIPLLDGSALGWVNAIEEVGLIEINTSLPIRPKLEKAFTLNRGNSVIAVTPHKSFHVIGIIDFPNKVVGLQSFAIELTPSSFVKEIAPARTFGFKAQVEQLRELGLIKGGSLNNALVCDCDHWINPPLRFHNEPVRHKILDLIGDLALVGFPKAQVLVYKGSHALHADLAAALINSRS